MLYLIFWPYTANLPDFRPFQTYVASTGISPFYLGEITGQSKNNIPFYVSGDINIADLITTFDLENEKVDYL